MTVAKGTVEIMELTEEEQEAIFSDYTEISIEGEKLSSATVSKRLKELVALGALEETETRTSSGRKTTGYQLTERGEKLLDLADEFREKMGSLE